jgi:uncharacterized protein
MTAKDDATLTSERRAEFADVLNAAERWVRARPDIVALGLAGSWARHEARMSSDIDLVVLTEEVETYLCDTSWIRNAAGQEGRIVRTRSWGPLTERRVQLLSGLLIEYGFTLVSWACVDPLDSGSARVVSDGFRIIYDPEGVLGLFVAAVRRKTTPPSGDEHGNSATVSLRSTHRCQRKEVC